jgi:Transcriptional Coactivator p15 (PC4)
MDFQASKLTPEGPSGLSAPHTPQTHKNVLADSARAVNGIPLPHIVAEWQKNGRETVRISISNYQRRAVIDCRVWYEAKDGELKPSPKGLTLALAHLPELAAGIAKALEVARRAGLVEGGDE